MSDKTTAVNLPEHSSSEPINSGPKMVKQFLQVEIFKRRWKNDSSDLNEPATKTTRVMLTLAALEMDNAQNIPTPLIYAKTVGDLVWRDVKRCHQGRTYGSCSKQHMKRSCSTQECQHCHKQVGVQVKDAHQWLSWQAKDKSSDKRILTDAWHQLWEHLCPNCEV